MGGVEIDPRQVESLQEKLETHDQNHEVCSSLQRWVLVQERNEGIGRESHHHDPDYATRENDPEFIGKRNRGYDRVNSEHDVRQFNEDDGFPEVSRARLFYYPFLGRKEKMPSAEPNQVTAAKEFNPGVLDDARDHPKRQEPEYYCAKQSVSQCLTLLTFGQLSRNQG